MTLSVSQLGYIGFGVSDADAWHDFLCGTLGLQEVGATDDGTRHFRLDNIRSRVQVRSTGEDDLAYVGWFVHDHRELQQMEAQLQAAGYDVEWGSSDLAKSRHVKELLVVDDPCGLRNEIATGATIAVEPLAPGRPMTKGFVAGDHGVGHVVIKSSDPDGYVRFYDETLGLRVTDFVANPGMGPMPGFSIAFYHAANGRHHSLAFPLIPLPAMGKRLQHFMIQVEDLDDLGRGQEIANEKGELYNYLGRHTNDRMLSAYLMSPSGVGLEYGWGARCLEPVEQTPTYYDGDQWGHNGVADKSIFDLAKPPEGAGPDGPPPGAGPGDLETVGAAPGGHPV